MFHYYVKDSFNSAEASGTKAGYESGLGTGGPSYVANLYKQNDDGTEFAVEADF